MKAPKRKRSLKTFSQKHVRTRKMSQLERDKGLILSTIKKKMQFSIKTGKPIGQPGEQILEYPLSLCDNDGNPLKGQKSYFTKSLNTRYTDTNPPVITTELPHDWIPECCILEGMFMINTTPLGCHTTMTDYANFLFRRYVVPNLKKGMKEIHIIFDSPGRLKNTPKYFEQKRRDANAKISMTHRCDDIIGSTKVIRGKWRESFLNCRECKRKLAIFLGEFFLNNCSSYLQDHQAMYIAGTFEGDIRDTAWFVRGKSPKQPDPEYICNAEEIDRYQDMVTCQENTTQKYFGHVSRHRCVQHWSSSGVS